MSRGSSGVGLALAALLATPAQALEPDKLFEKVSPSVFIVLAFDAIHMLKLTDPLKESVLNGAGYVGQLAKA